MVDKEQEKVEDCPFCRIVERPQDESHRIIEETEDFLAMLVTHPQTRGHFIVYPKRHVSELALMQDSVGRLMETAVGLAERVTRNLGAKAYVLRLNNKLFALEDNPMHVGHIHLHVVPRYLPDEISGEKPQPVSLSELGEVYYAITRT